MPMLRPYDRVPIYVPKCVEQERLAEEARGRAPWKKWGTYLAERCWGTVREDYSASGDAWNHLCLISREINTPRLIVRMERLGEHRWLAERLPHRITRAQREPAP